MAFGLVKVFRPQPAIWILAFLVVSQTCCGYATCSQRAEVRAEDCEDTAVLLQSARHQEVKEKGQAEVGESTSGKDGRAERSSDSHQKMTTQAASGANKTSNTRKMQDADSKPRRRSAQDEPVKTAQNLSQLGLTGTGAALESKPSLHHALFVQIGHAALSAVTYLASPGSTVPSVIPFFVIGVLLLASIAALYHCLSTPVFIQEAQTASVPSRGSRRAVGWPMMSPSTTSKGALQDPYMAYVSSSTTLPPKTRAGTGITPPPMPSAGSGPASQVSIREPPPPSEPRRSSLRPVSLPVSGGGGRPGSTQSNIVPNEGMSEKPNNGLPPPLYAALVLPAREAHLEIPVPSLATVKETGVGRFFVLGPLGNKIMHVTLCGSAFDVHMASSELVASVSLQYTDSKPRLEICGPDGVIYGNVLERQTFGTGRGVEKMAFSVVVRSPSGEAGQDLLLISGNPEEMRLTATSAVDGQPVASASPESTRRTSNGRKLEIRTQRRADTALVLSCFVAILILHPKKAANSL
eukprot:CAMPEP_0197659016 /NCGR_PEP_ID=MMETSP1338-20131121/45850_1 /TAXON_ID=43686 ORGANISM="Pelagodinium beii, Strain RCC1491" /NCGR_SAMPLE_ID=MMETSP1338 /ASSEMBLY_ACC=CAM_ASM_000754 /LENGTH=521 /DNA_ID=CAMNT_0043235749 /DNA_START=116 /DNA_END=1681 /DNA_ORIENTATION=-